MPASWSRRFTGATLLPKDIPRNNLKELFRFTPLSNHKNYSSLKKQSADDAISEPNWNVNIPSLRILNSLRFVSALCFDMSVN